MRILTEPRKPAFEVKDCQQEQSYLFVCDREKNVVHLFNKDRQRRLIQTYGPEKFPLDASNAWEYFCNLYKKAVLGIDDVIFVDYVEEND